MSAESEFLNTIVRYRADAIAVVGLVIVACLICRSYVRRHGAVQEFSGMACVTVVALAFAGALLAEWTLLVLGYPASVSRVALAARALVLGAASLIAVGGAAYLVAKAIRKSKVLAFEDLGMEAIYEFDVKEMPVTVAVDARGVSVHQSGPADWQKKIVELKIPVHAT